MSPGHERPRSRSTLTPHSRITQRPTISPVMYCRSSSSEPNKFRNVLMLIWGSSEIRTRGWDIKLVIVISWRTRGYGLSITDDGFLRSLLTM